MSDFSSSEILNSQDLVSRQAAIEALDKRFDSIPMEQTTEILMLRRDLRELPPAPERTGRWIPTWERLPDNANDPGAFCPRYQVMTEFGVTEGWYRPYDNGRGGCWYALIWFMTEQYEIWNIDFERGDVPKVIGNVHVSAWRPMTEPYKEANE